MLAGTQDYGRREPEAVCRQEVGPYPQYPGLWHRVFGGTDCSERPLPAHHAALRTGMPRGGKHRRSSREDQRRNRSLTSRVLILLTTWVVWSMCCSRDRSDPERAYAHARSTLVHGNLIGALSEVQHDARRYERLGPEWSWQFRLLEAEILVWQGRNQNVVDLLTGELPPDLAGGKMGIERHTQLGIAYYRLGRSQEADQHLAEADRLCPNYSCALAGELARAHGVVETDRGDLTAADDLFRKSLDFARDRHDEFQEATALMNLGTIAMLQGHFDASVDWSSRARDIARRLGAAITEEKTLGNLGWAYYSMGDFDRSEALLLSRAVCVRRWRGS